MSDERSKGGEGRVPLGVAAVRISDAGRAAAGVYVRSIRKVEKLRYAQRYLAYMLAGEGEPPEHEGLGFVAAQAVRLRLMEILRVSAESVSAPAPAFLVFHDGVDGAMEVWTENGLAIAEGKAARLQERLESMGYDDCGVWRAYAKLPACPVWKRHDREHGNA